MRVTELFNDVQTLYNILSSMSDRANHTNPHEKQPDDFNSVYDFLKDVLGKTCNIENDYPLLYANKKILVNKYLTDTGLIENNELTIKGFEFIAIFESESRIIEELRKIGIPTSIENIFLAKNAKIMNHF